MKIRSRFIGLLSIISSLSCFSSCLYAADSIYAPSLQNKTNLASTQIVGGQPALSSDWPWMTAYVVTFQGVSTSLRVDDLAYGTTAFSFGPAGNATGALVACGKGEATCANASAKVCLIERGDINFSEKALNCESGGGIAAIIYNNEVGEISGTLGEDFNGTIPVVAITREDGLTLLTQEGAIAQVSVSATTQLQQDSSCGATFLGDKWVLTAAHCVDSADAMFFKMNVGEYDLSDGAENASSIANIYIHPQYDADLIDYDIALVELVETVDAPAVQLASKTTTDQYAIENSPAIVAGWGGRVGYAPGEGPTADFPDVLHQVELNLATNAQCRTKINSQSITDRMICATQPSSGKGSCQGDSGGPLIVQTGTGPQQVGIVSWGIGCADPNYPGVYTRVAEFTEWLHTLQTGIAIRQKQDFGISPISVSQSSTLQVVNNSTFSVALSFNITGSNTFSLGTNTCANLAAGASCDLNINLNANQTGELSATVTINANNNVVATSSASLNSQVIATATNIAGVAGTNNNSVSWYSGGNKPWLANSTSSGVQSGSIDHNQESILSAYVQGKGKFNFQWSVSSEENEEDPSDPYDALYVYVNNELQDLISGSVAFEDFPTINLETDNSIITWIYRKDPATVAGDDKAYIRNVVFTPNQVTTTPPPTTPVTNNNSGGGGSLGWLSLISLLVLLRLSKRVN
ncbi:trypsin-like serine protease [Paraglaciecola hydrolytica]|uniref:Trypsin n=1 Tax=Paraglaciecola hydrolytica TaxID=1799789 RepID=A0A136A057_9ALTE|nr:trypsin-like serine protease [Paraglaciecola hydrolytica]KXI28573.1 trypsin [Paraglaciecola hydrolytica]